MKYNKLGKSTLEVSEIGFGCMSLHKDYDNATALINKAIDLGINFFDTADLYDTGKNEQFLGKALHNNRKNVIIATKVGNQIRPDGAGWDWNPTKKYILIAIEDSLRRLNTDYIDLYQLHGGTIEDRIDESIEAFEILKAQGKILYYGISSIRPNVIREYVKSSNIESVMMQYSLLDRRPEETCLDLLQQNQISVLSRGALAQGLLVDKAGKNYLNFSEDEVKHLVKKLNVLATNGRTNTQIALNYVLRNPALASTVVGISNSGQLTDIINTLDNPPLKHEEIIYLQNNFPAAVYDNHR